nr:AAA family ATPase [bacterium]
MPAGVLQASVRVGTYYSHLSKGRESILQEFALCSSCLYTEAMESTEEILVPPIGVSDFNEIRTDNFYFVDKTCLIAKLLKNKTKVTLFTRPRRFGKTLNMSMLQRFFDCNYEPCTRTTPADNRRLFDGLSICQNAEAMAEQGKYPVIFMSLKDLKSTTWEVMSEDFAELMFQTYKNFSYLLDSPQLTKDDK